MKVSMAEYPKRISDMGRQPKWLQLGKNRNLIKFMDRTCQNLMSVNIGYG